MEKANITLYTVIGDPGRIVTAIREHFKEMTKEFTPENGNILLTLADDSTISFNINHRQDKPDFIASHTAGMANYFSSAETPQVRAGIGDKFPVIYGKSYMRNDEGKIVVDKNGLPMQGEDAVIGTVSPDFRLGFNTNIELYKFRISAVFDWKQGGQMYSGTAGEMNYYGVSKLSGDMRNTEFIVENSVKETGKDADGNSIYAPNDIKVTDAQAYFTRRRSIDESYIYDNSYIKLRELSVSYPVFSKKWLNVNVNVFARNILVWSEMKGFDPEASQGNDNMGGAFERFSLPGTASYGFGFNVKF